MKRRKWARDAVAGALVAALAGCATAHSTSNASATPAEGVAPTPAEAEAFDEVREHHRHHHHGGLAMFVALSADSLGLPPEKEAALTGIRAELRQALAPAHRAEHALLVLLVDGVASGSIDTAKVDAAVAEVASASAGVHAAALHAITELHDLLSSSERVALVEKVRAHWTIWREVNFQEKPGSMGPGTRLTRLAAELRLTPEQVHRIEHALSGGPSTEDSGRMQDAIDAFARTFARDHFDAASLEGATAANRDIATWGAARMARFYEAVTPVLTPEQRATLAAELRTRAAPPATADVRAP